MVYHTLGSSKVTSLAMSLMQRITLVVFTVISIALRRPLNISYIRSAPVSCYLLEPISYNARISVHALLDLFGSFCHRPGDRILFDMWPVFWF